MADKDKNKMVDFPGYDPDKRVPFPPGAGSPFGQSPPKKQQIPEEKQPFYENYNPDPTSPDPSQTTPGAADIRDPNTKLPNDAELEKYSPDVDLKE